MEEKIYRINGIRYEVLGTPNERPTITTGTIRGEVEANNWRKFFNSSMPNFYFRMVEVSEEGVPYIQAPIEQVLAKAGRL